MSKIMHQKHIFRRHTEISKRRTKSTFLGLFKAQFPYKNILTNFKFSSLFYQVILQVEGFDPAEYYRQQQQQMLLQASQHVEQTRDEIQRVQEQVILRTGYIFDFAHFKMPKNGRN